MAKGTAGGLAACGRGDCERWRCGTQAADGGRGWEDTSLQRSLGAAGAVARGGGGDVVGCRAFGNGVLVVWLHGNTEWPGLIGNPKGLHIAKKKGKERMLGAGAGTIGRAEVSLSSSLLSRESPVFFSLKMSKGEALF